MQRMLSAKSEPRSAHNASEVGPKIANRHISANSAKAPLCQAGRST